MMNKDGFCSSCDEVKPVFCRFVRCPNKVELWSWITPLQRLLSATPEICSFCSFLHSSLVARWYSRATLSDFSWHTGGVPERIVKLLSWDTLPDTDECLVCEGTVPSQSSRLADHYCNSCIPFVCHFVARSNTAPAVDFKIHLRILFNYQATDRSFVIGLDTSDESTSSLIRFVLEKTSKQRLLHIALSTG